MSHPRIALAHDFLSQHGGAERVVLRFAQLFPEAPIYTAFHDRDGAFPAFRELDVRTSPMQDRIDPTRFRRQVLQYPAAFRAFDLSAYDLVLVSSSGFAHHVAHPRTLVYCHTPPRFLHAPHTYASGGAGRRLAAAAGPLLTPLRRRDRAAARACASYAANSQVTARRVRRVYGLDARVIHPPLNVEHLVAEPSPLPERPAAIVVSRLLPYKRVDVAVAACRLAGLPLTVVGEGPERERLEAAAGPGTRFVGRVDDARLGELIAAHSVLLVPGAEDFGFMPLEANYSGRPVVARDAAGPRETVDHGRTGLRVPGTDPEHWAAALRDAVARDWDPEALRAATEPFSGARFDAAVRAWVAEELARGS